MINRILFLFAICWVVMGAFSVCVATGEWPIESTDQINFNQASSDAAWGLGSWLVVWMENDDIKGIRLDVNQEPLDCGIDISDPSAGHPFGPSVAYGNGAWLVVWTFTEYSMGEDYVGVRGQRIALDGSKIGETQTLFSTILRNVREVDVAWGQNSWRVVWEQSGANNFCVRTVVVNEDGSVETTQNISTCSTLAALARRPAIARGTNAWLVVYPELGGAGYEYLRSKTIPYDGSDWSQNILDWDNHGDHAWPAIAYGNSEWLVTWTDYRNSTEDIYAQRRNMAGDAIGDSFPVFTGSHNDTYSEVAYSSGRYQVIFQSDDGGNDDIIGQRVNVDGTLNGSPFYMAYTAADQTSPAIAGGNGGTFLNTWTDQEPAMMSITGRINTNSSSGGDNFLVADTDGNSCDDELFCTGTESCNSDQCVSTGNPCSSNETCDEVNDMCVPELTCGDSPEDEKTLPNYSFMLLMIFGTVFISKMAGRK